MSEIAFAEQYYASESHQIRTDILAQVAKSNDFDAIYKFLSIDDSRKASKPGQYVHSQKINGDRFYSLIHAPNNIQEGMKYPVHIYLHGNVNTSRWRKMGEWWPRASQLKREEHITVFPASWHEHKWWSKTQIQNIQQVLDFLKANYLVDTDRIYIFGVSDGATGVYYLAPKLAHQLAGGAAIMGSPRVLAGNRNDVNDDTFPINIINIPLLMINATNDRLYPDSAVTHYADYFKAFGAPTEFIAIEGSHSYATFSKAIDIARSKLIEHSRRKHPHRIAIQTDDLKIINRIHWLQVLSLQPNCGEHLPKGLMNRNLDRAVVEATIVKNQIVIDAYCVAKLRILVSKELVSFELPITVTVNGEKIFERTIKPDIYTLTEYAALDFDPLVLYSAKIDLKLDGSSSIIEPAQESSAK